MPHPNSIKSKTKAYFVSDIQGRKMSSSSLTYVDIIIYKTTHSRLPTIRAVPLTGFWTTEALPYNTTLNHERTEKLLSITITKHYYSVIQYLMPRLRHSVTSLSA
jgi:hypothetical protein